MRVFVVAATQAEASDFILRNRLDTRWTCVAAGADALPSVRPTNRDCFIVTDIGPAGEMLGFIRDLLDADAKNVTAAAATSGMMN